MPLLTPVYLGLSDAYITITVFTETLVSFQKSPKVQQLELQSRKKMEEASGKGVSDHDI